MLQDMVSVPGNISSKYKCKCDYKYKYKYEPMLQDMVSVPGKITAMENWVSPCTTGTH